MRYAIIAGVTISASGGYLNAEIDETEVIGRALSLEQAWGIAAQSADERPIAIIPIADSE